ncbi:MAG: Flp family type IVb pilin [Firmicutes bacterium]|nr:Flp family type IVb pilin [Bacillota bacterium]
MVPLISRVWNRMRGRMQDQSGQSMAEYAMILALVVVAILATLTNLGVAIQGVFQNIITKLGG